MSATAEWSLAVTDDPPAAAQAAILDGLVAYNAAQIGPSDMRPLAVLVRDAAGTVIGGLTGETARGWLSIRLFFLPETLRGDGLGSRVLAAAEAEAVARGCHHARLDTYGFQAPGFYRKQGYTMFGDLERYPDAHHRFFLQKALTGSGSVPG